MGTVMRSDDLVATYSSKGPTFLDHVVKPESWRQAISWRRVFKRIVVVWPVSGKSGLLGFVHRQHKLESVSDLL